MSPYFMERLILSMSGPLIATVLGTLIIGSFATWTARRVQNRRSNFDLRHELAAEMSLAANHLYFAIRYYLHSKAGILQDGLGLKDVAPVMHEQYRQSRALGSALESRLRAYFMEDDVRSNWHAAMDLLEVQYYLAIGQASEELVRSNAGPEHSTLTVDQLIDREVVVDTYRTVLRASISGVLAAKIVPPSKMR